MVDYELSAPGVYVEEVTPAGPIAGAGTTVTALIGTVARPPVADRLGHPEAVTSWTGYETLFGGRDNPALHLPFAVRGFFENGGALAYVVPIADTGGLDEALDA